jgi:hypothetical protein
MSKMSLKAVQPSVEEFIRGANQTPATDYPWDEPKVREDVMKLVSLRLSEPYILKLQWLSEQTGKPQQKLLRDLVLPWIDEQIEKLSEAKLS